ncbi:MAG: hypothetical protein QOJ94_677 [Sphingomonadales bacterium]|jgi:hypothetical protein|nr:hypothetical protein [Sphingomonadales bacterium]
MGKTVILSVTTDDWEIWGDQFVKRQRLAREQLTISPGVQPEAARAKLITAMNKAGAGGTLIVSVGHGSAGQLPREGTVELAPGRALSLGGANAAVPPNFVSVFYDVPLGPPPAISDLDNDRKNNPGSVRLRHWQAYQEMAAACRKAALREVVFMTCKVGRSSDFLKKIANDWNVVVRAFTVQVGIASPKPRPLVFLANDPPPYALAATTILHEEELPVAPGHTIRVGPPL